MCRFIRILLIASTWIIASIPAQCQDQPVEEFKEIVIAASESISLQLRADIEKIDEAIEGVNAQTESDPSLFRISEQLKSVSAVNMAVSGDPGFEEVSLRSSTESLISQSRFVRNDLQRDFDKITELLEQIEDSARADEVAGAIDGISLSDASSSVIFGANTPISNALGTFLQRYYLTPTLSAHRAVGFIGRPRFSTGKYAAHCTGTLIRNDVVLTAAHCFCEDELDETKDCEKFIADDLVSESYVFFLPGSGIHNITQVKVHPDYRLFTSRDVALFRLSSVVADVRPAEIKLDKSSAPVGSQIVTVGYGRYNRNDDETFEGFGFDWLRGTGIKVPGELSIQSCSELKTDNLDRYIEKYGAPVFEDDELLCWNQGTNTGEALFGTCSGDSGGPAYHGRRIVGVISAGFGGSNCHELGRVNARLAPQEKFIAATLDREWPESSTTRARSEWIAHKDIWYQPRHASDYEWRFMLPSSKARLPKFEKGASLIITLNGDSDHRYSVEVYLEGDANAKCISSHSESFQECVIANPSSGNWRVVVETEHIRPRDASFQLAALLRPAEN